MFNETLEWKSVEEDWEPVCNGESIFIGKNIHGFYGIFNAKSKDRFGKTIYIYEPLETTGDEIGDLEYYAQFKGHNTKKGE